ncbi:hypothetical protein LQZ21_08620 [Treponema sp. TIM-1]|uniref:hypothetical protein n=1 Tax=Treponema sp. TIM-1 TaxID=2898417 RepID=UPI00397FB9D0
MVILKSWFLGDYWSIIWPVILFLLIILITLDSFYLINRRFLQLLEKEDWPALVRYLEQRIFKDGHYTPRLVRLLANAYLILSDSSSVVSMENKVAIAKPALVDANALIFGTARILNKDVGGALTFFSTRLNSVKTESAPWVRWYYGFSLLLDRQFSAAGDQFKVLAAESKDGIITGLSSFFLAENLGKAVPQRSLEFTAAAMEGRNRLKKSFPSVNAWNREVKKILNEVYTVVLSKYINETTVWLFGN